MLLKKRIYICPDLEMYFDRASWLSLEKKIEEEERKEREEALRFCLVHNRPLPKYLFEYVFDSNKIED